MDRTWARLGAVVAAGSLLVGIASTSAGASTAPVDTTPADTTPVEATATEDTAAHPQGNDAANWTVRPGYDILAVLDAPPGVPVELLAADESVVAESEIDLAGSVLFRDLAPGAYRVRDVRSGTVTTLEKLHDPADVPPQTFYAEQSIEPGFGYLTTRDGTTLSVNVSLPGDPADGPYPTLVEYSGYEPSDPDATGYPQIINALGFAYVGVNIRGSGCSGGSFYYFDNQQIYDGYDVIETIAAQPWVKDHRVGMTGISYPGISQLFVAQTQPPSLAAITPLSVIDDSYRAVLYPGGILNTGFGVNWLQQRMESTSFAGQQWAADRIADGDAECERNQRLRLQNVDLVQRIGDNPTYVAAEYDRVAPRLFIDRITVPVLLAGAWQDEQTGSHFATMLEGFTGTEHVYFTLSNGLHTEPLGPANFARMAEFLDLYVAGEVPDLSGARSIAGLLSETLFGTDDVELPADRFTGMSYDEALLAFESEPPVQLNLEVGAAEGFTGGAPMARFSLGLDAWPASEMLAHIWYLDDGELVIEPKPVESDEDPIPTLSYVADPTVVPPTFYDAEATGSDGVWRYDVTYDWVEPPAENLETFLSAPFETDTILVGGGAVDLWIKSSTGDTDIEVTLSEVRPDGTEVFIQGGWLRASHRALDELRSVPLMPVQTHLAEDVAPLPPDEWTPVRVEIFPFAHPMRAGSQLRLLIAAPGGNRAIWEFDTISAGETVEIAYGADYPSSVSLGAIDPASLEASIPAEYPDCTLRGQPCR